LSKSCAEAYCGERRGDDAAMEATLAALEGVSALLCAKIGERPRERLATAGITASGIHRAFGDHLALDPVRELSARLVRSCSAISSSGRISSLGAWSSACAARN
jgi:Dinitrogenase iron-molybdenum cofactor